MLTKKIFISTWILSLLLSALSGIIVRAMPSKIGDVTFWIRFYVRGWPQHWMLQNAAGTWTISPNDFIVNALIWWLGIMAFIVVIRFFQKRKNSA
jgi:hypothetical protein